MVLLNMSEGVQYQKLAKLANMIKYFKSKKIKSYNGLNMFIYQGQKAFYLWNKINPEIDDELLNLLESKLN